MKTLIAGIIYFFIIMFALYSVSSHADWRVSWEAPTTHENGELITAPISYRIESPSFVWSGSQTTVDIELDGQYTLFAVVQGLDSAPVVINATRNTPSAPLGFSIQWITPGEPAL